MARLGREERDPGGEERGERERERKREGEPKRKEEGGLADRPPTGAAWADRVAGGRRCSLSPARAAAAGPLNGEGSVRSPIGQPGGGRAGIGQRKGAGPPSGMYYGASGTSVRAGGARASPGLLGGSAGDVETAGHEQSAPTSLPP